MVQLIIPRHVSVFSSALLLKKISRTPFQHAIFLNPVGDAIKDDVVMRTLNDIGRTVFANSQITVDLLPSIGITILALVAIYAVLSALGVLPSDAASTGYSAPSSEYGAPASSYDAFARLGDSSYYKQALGDLQERIANLKESPVFSYYSTNQGGSNGPSSVDVGYTA